MYYYDKPKGETMSLPIRNLTSNKTKKKSGENIKVKLITSYCKITIVFCKLWIFNTI